MNGIVEIVSIGNELLIGRISNTNAQWLAERVTRLGGHVRRIGVVGDSLDEISSVLEASLMRGTPLILTTGGLGPTFDDLTLEAIARTFGVPLTVNAAALKMVEEKYRQYGDSVGKEIELTPARLKMATLPEGGKSLRNPVGTAPGVLMVRGESRIVALPGVPKEMEAIFEENVEPLVKAAVGSVFVGERSLKVSEIMESAIAPLIDEVMRDNPHVYIKSHPKASESRPSIELHLMTVANKRCVGLKRIDVTAKRIAQLVLANGGTIHTQS